MIWVGRKSFSQGVKTCIVSSNSNTLQKQGKGPLSTSTLHLTWVYLNGKTARLHSKVIAVEVLVF